MEMLEFDPVEELLVAEDDVEMEMECAGDGEELGKEAENNARLYGDTDLVQIYFHSIETIPLLSKDEEVALAKKINDGQTAIAEIIRPLRLTQEIRKEMVMKKMLGTADIFGRDARVTRMVLRRLEIFIRTIEYIDAETEWPEVLRKIEKETGVRIAMLESMWEKIAVLQRSVEENRNNLVSHNLRLVVSIAKKYSGKGLPFEDLVQEGNQGLIRAAEKFNCAKGFKFSTYATWWVRHFIVRALLQSRCIHIPVHFAEFYNRIIRATKELTLLYGRKPKDNEIAEKLAIPVSYVAKAHQMMREPLSLENPVGEQNKDNDMLKDIIEDGLVISPCTQAESSELTEKIEKILQTLPERENFIISRRFGIGCEKEHTLEEIGSVLKLTRERVRQIEAKAMRKLSRSERRLKLQKLL